jgi:hypothetical protein
MTKNTNFFNAREHTIQAAKNYFGNSSTEVIAVTDAWHAVGVGDKYPTSIIGATNNVCYSGTMFTLHNPPQGSIQWSVIGPFTLTTVAGNTSAIIVKKTALSNSSGSLTAKIGNTVIDSKTITPCQTTISSPSHMCDQGTFTLNNVPPGATIEWQSTMPVWLSLFSGQGTNNAVYQKMSTNGIAMVRAKVTWNNVSLDIYSNYVRVGVPERPHVMDISGTICTLPSVTYTLYYGATTISKEIHFIDPETSAGGGNWITEQTINPNSFQLIPNGNYATVNPLQLGGGAFTVKNKNVCGTSSPTTVYLTIKQKPTTNGRFFRALPSLPHFSIIVTPNPSFDEITVNVFEEYEIEYEDDLSREVIKEPFEREEKYIIQLWNTTGLLLKTIESNQPSVQIPLYELQTGVYKAIMIMDGQYMDTQNVMIK